MNPANILPWIIVALFIGSSLVCFFTGDIKKGFYWAFGAGINITVIFM